MRFAIIDLNNLYFRALNGAGKNSDAFTKAGMSVHIIFQTLRKLHREFAIDHMVFCLDSNSWRNGVYPQYKLKRKLSRLERSEREKEEDEIGFSVLQDFTTFISEHTRCTVLQKNGVEADDFVARWTQLHPDDTHFILSSDSDFLQLIAENISIIDGMGERVITLDGVKNLKGEELVFAVDSKDGKLKVEGTVEACKKAHGAAEKAKRKIDPAYTPAEYVNGSPGRAQEWWREALFLKIIRGDVGDGIFSAYPKVRYKGTSKATGIREAWEDRGAGGFHWNNFMLQKWSKMTGLDGTAKEVRVIDEYKFNESLIDLTKQPEDVKNSMDEAIIEAAQKPSPTNIGIALLKFCGKQSLPVVAKDASDHAKYLGAGYKK